MRSSTYRFSEDMGADTVRAPYGRVSDGIGDDTVGQHRCGYGRLLLGRHRCLGAQLHPHTHKPEQPAVRSNFTKVQKFALLVLKSLKTGPKLRAPYGTKNRSPPPRLERCGSSLAGSHQNQRGLCETKDGIRMAA